jgi:uncharacterized protein (TIRG00374 family)
LLQLLALLFVFDTFVLPQLAGTRDALELLGSLNPIMLALGLLLEVASLWCVAHLIRTLLPVENRPASWTVQRIVLSARAASRVVPGGAAASGALSYRLLRRVGVPTQEAGFSVGTQSLESAAVLIVLLFIALFVSIPFSGLSAAYLGVTIVGLVVLSAIGALVFAVTRGEERAVGIARRIATTLRFLNPDSVEGLLRVLASEITELASDRRELVRHAFWSSAYWLLDAASLWVFVAAYGHYTRVDGLIIAFCLANIAATIPITPGGLGVMELTLVASLAGFGVPYATALLAVASWRLVNFWLPMPAGAAAYLSLNIGSPDESRSENLQGLTEEVRKGATEANPFQRIKTWRNRPR